MSSYPRIYRSSARQIGRVGLYMGSLGISPPYYDSRNAFRQNRRCFTYTTSEFEGQIRPLLGVKRLNPLYFFRVFDFTYHASRNCMEWQRRQILSDQGKVMPIEVALLLYQSMREEKVTNYLLMGEDDVTVFYVSSGLNTFSLEVETGVDEDTGDPWWQMNAYAMGEEPTFHERQRIILLE
jgi:hypothetical protein